MNIYESISKVMADIGAVGKNSKNATQGFMFRGIDAVMNALNPALVKNKVFAVPEVLEQSREERTNAKGTTLIYSICKVRYTFYAEDGTSVSATVIGEGMDTGDKATNKAMSIAFKYACFQVFCIPTEEMADPDAESHSVRPTERQITITPAETDPRKVRINDEYATIIESALADKGIDNKTVFTLYKIDDIRQLTVYKANNLMDNLDRVLAMQKES